MAALPALGSFQNRRWNNALGLTGPRAQQETASGAVPVLSGASPFRFFPLRNGQRRGAFPLYNTQPYPASSQRVSRPPRTREAPHPLARRLISEECERLERSAECCLRRQPEPLLKRGRVDAAEVDVRLQVAVHEIGQAGSRTGRTPANAAAE